MRIAELLRPETVITGLSAPSGEAALAQMVSSLVSSRGVDADLALKDLAARERSGPTLLCESSLCVAAPHARTKACKQLVLAVGTSREGIPWAGTIRKANLIFVLLGPPETHALYLRILGRMARLCQPDRVVESLVSAASPGDFIETLAAAEEPLGELVAGEGMPTFCVLGAGHGGLAMAAHLALTGCKVNLFNRSEERILSVRSRGGIDVTGEVDGFAPLNRVTSDPAEAIDDVDVLMVVVPATAHRNIAQIIAPHIRDGQVLVLNPGRTGGALEVAQVLREKNPAARPYIAEAQTLLYAARATNPGQVHIFGIKNSVPLAALPSYQTVDILPVIRKALPQFVPGSNVLTTSLDNIGAVFHPAITILNAGRIEDTHGDFEYYVEGVTPAVAGVLEAIDHERVAVAGALGIRAHTAREWLYLAYDAAGKTLLDAMRANPGYAGIRAPATVQHRYITEDVPASLVPIASIGEMLGVPTPTIQAMIRLASAMHGVDYWAEGRTVERLGLRGMSVKDIRFLVVGAESSAQPMPSSGNAPAGEVAKGLNLRQQDGSLRPGPAGGGCPHAGDQFRGAAPEGLRLRDAHGGRADVRSVRQARRLPQRRRHPELDPRSPDRRAGLQLPTGPPGWRRDVRKGRPAAQAGAALLGTGRPDQGPLLRGPSGDVRPGQGAEPRGGRRLPRRRNTDRDTANPGDRPLRSALRTG
jgi:opine dehydrogenase